MEKNVVFILEGLGSVGKTRLVEKIKALIPDNKLDGVDVYYKKFPEGYDKNALKTPEDYLREQDLYFRQSFTLFTKSIYILDRAYPSTIAYHLARVEQGLEEEDPTLVERVRNMVKRYGFGVHHHIHYLDSSPESSAQRDLDGKGVTFETRRLVRNFLRVMANTSTLFTPEKVEEHDMRLNLEANAIVAMLHDYKNKWAEVK